MEVRRRFTGNCVLVAEIRARVRHTAALFPWGQLSDRAVPTGEYFVYACDWGKVPFLGAQTLYYRQGIYVLSLLVYPCISISGKRAVVYSYAGREMTARLSYPHDPTMNKAPWDFRKDVVIVVGRVEMWTIELPTMSGAGCG